MKDKQPIVIEKAQPSQRLQIAAQIMASMMASSIYERSQYAHVAKDALDAADALIKVAEQK